jgi:chemotaxis protein methyltransferase CheR
MPDPGLRLSVQQHRAIAEQVRDRLGLQILDMPRSTLERRLLPRLRATGCPAFSDYEQHLRFLPVRAPEWERLAEALSVHETYFFRQRPQLDVLSRDLLPMLARKADRRLSVWSAPCATGEEAYTLAILLIDSGLFTGWDARIYGSDISERCIAHARRGVYGRSAFREVDPGTLSAHIRPLAADLEAGGPRYEVSGTLRALCHFGRQNLLDAGPFAPLGAVDLIMCRNLLIYLDARARRAVLELFFERLAPGGFLLLGHAESLLHMTTHFEFLHLDGDLVYKKPLTPPTT